MPRDLVSESELFVAPAITPSRELGPDLPARVDPVLAYLERARAYVAAGWCGLPFSIDADGQPNMDCANEAAILRGVKFCGEGALWRVYYESGEGLGGITAKLTAGRLLGDAAQSAGSASLVHLNSEHGQKAVVSAYDRAIFSRKAEGR